jgi:hypothetical protein
MLYLTRIWAFITLSENAEKVTLDPEEIDVLRLTGTFEQAPDSRYQLQTLSDQLIVRLYGQDGEVVAELASELKAGRRCFLRGHLSFDPVEQEYLLEVYFKDVYLYSPDGEDRPAVRLDLLPDIDPFDDFEITFITPS